MRWALVGVVVAALGLPPTAAWGAETTLVLDGDVPSEGLYFTVPFDVPPGTLEIEIRHSDLSDDNILDWGLLSPDGFVGWGGGNEEDVLVGETYASRSYAAGPIPAGQWQVLVGKARIDEMPATFALEVTMRDEVTGSSQVRSEYADVTLSEEPGWFAGDLHVHSEESGDARPPLTEIGTFARNRGLDFVVISDHNVHTALDFFEAAQADHPELLFVPGVEFTTYAGHANGIGATSWVDFRVGDTTSIEAAAGSFHEQGALFAVNHPVLELGPLCIGCAWAHELDPGLINAVELTNGGGLQPFGWTFIDEAMAYWDGLCAQGFHVAPIGGSDDHKAGVDLNMFQSPIGDGTTMVWAESLSAQAIVEGIRQGRTVVKLQGPDDPMVDFDAAGRQGDTVRGESIELRAEISGANGQTARLVVDGEPQAAFAVEDDPFERIWSVDAPPSGQQRYRVEVLVDGSLRTVTSHLWVEFAEQPDPTGTSTGAAQGSGGGESTTGPTTPDPSTDGGSSTGDAAQSQGEASGCGCSQRGPTHTPWILLGVICLPGLLSRRTCWRTRRRSPRPTS